MYSEHAEYTVVIPVTAEKVFTWLDDPTRLSQHMSKRSWKMGWRKMDTVLDERRGRAVGSHIVFSGRAFGIRLYLDELVMEHEPPYRKSWETVGEPRLLVIGPYRMGFELLSAGTDTRLRVLIDYELPKKGTSRWLGQLFGQSYARWCVQQMAEDAKHAFAR
jgi:hypothetical protein